jgi:hypothetical protein
LAAGVGGEKTRYSLVDVAILVFVAAAVVLASIPVLLEFFGSDWKAVRVGRSNLIRKARP